MLNNFINILLLIIIELINYYQNEDMDMNEGNDMKSLNPRTSTALMVNKNFSSDRKAV